PKQDFRRLQDTRVAERLCFEIHFSRQRFDLLLGRRLPTDKFPGARHRTIGPASDNLWPPLAMLWLLLPEKEPEILRELFRHTILARKSQNGLVLAAGCTLS